MLARRAAVAFFLIALPVAVASHPAWAQNDAAGRKLAFLVGVKRYDHELLKDLDFPENDVEDLGAVLKAQNFETVVLTTGRGKQNAKDKPTAENIRARLKALLSGANKRDLIVVALAGHGIQPLGADDSFFCPADANPVVRDGKPIAAKSLIAMGEILGAMTESGIGDKLLMVDACRNDPSARSAKRRGVDHVSASTLPGRTGVLLSCSEGEFSFEEKSLGGGHGVFFYNVIEGLKGKAKDPQGRITWDGLALYVRTEVPPAVEKLFGKDGGEQNPNAMGNLRGVPTVLARAIGPVKSTEVISIQPPEFGFFSQQVNYKGIPVKAHADVDESALLEGRRRIAQMLDQMPVAAENLADVGAEVHIIGKNQQTSDLPSWRHLKGTTLKTRDGKSKDFDGLVRGVGGLLASCGEENLLKLPSDRFPEHRDICVGHFARTVFDFGLSPDVRELVGKQFKDSVAEGLWKTARASTNEASFFAELSMWYFNSRGDFGRIEPKPQEGREWLRNYDPKAFEVLDRIYSGRTKNDRMTWEKVTPRSAEEETNLRSVSHDKPMVLVFENSTSEEHSIFWLGYDGKRKAYGTLHTGERRVQPTFATHPWLVAKADGHVVAVYLPSTLRARVVLK